MTATTVSASLSDVRRARHNGAARAFLDNLLDTFLEYADGSATGTPQSCPKAFESTAELLGLSPADVATVVRLSSVNVDILGEGFGDPEPAHRFDPVSDRCACGAEIVRYEEDDTLRCELSETVLEGVR